MNSTDDTACARGLDNLDLQLTCVDCGLTANVSVGTDFEINLGGNASCVPSATESCFGVNRAALNFTVDDIALSANLELFLGSQLNKAGNYSCVSFYCSGILLNDYDLYFLGCCVFLLNQDFR